MMAAREPFARPLLRYSQLSGPTQGSSGRPLRARQRGLEVRGGGVGGPAGVVLVPTAGRGTAAGCTGFVGVVFGSASGGSGVGGIADRFGWTGVFGTMVACCLLTIAFSAMTLGHKAESAAR